jgi:hypothetical protein
MGPRKPLQTLKHRVSNNYNTDRRGLNQLGRNARDWESIQEGRETEGGREIIGGITYLTGITEDPGSTCIKRRKGGAREALQKRQPRRRMPENGDNHDYLDRAPLDKKPKESRNPDEGGKQVKTSCWRRLGKHIQTREAWTVGL